MAEDSTILSHYGWVTAVRLTGTSAQETHILLGHNTENAHLYKALQHIERAKARGYTPLPFPERYIEEIDLITRTLAEEQAGTFTIKPQSRYVLDRTRFRYRGGLRKRYSIIQNTGDASWHFSPGKVTNSKDLDPASQALIWDAEQQQWQPAFTVLPWCKQAFCGKVLSTSLSWPSDPTCLAYVIWAEQGTIQTGPAQCITKSGNVYPLTIVELLLGTLDAALLFNGDKDEEMAFARFMVIWGNTTTVLALIQGLQPEQASTLDQIIQP